MRKFFKRRNNRRLNKVLKFYIIYLKLNDDVNIINENENKDEDEQN